MTDKPFDPTKPVKFRGQPYPVRVIATDLVGEFPIVVAWVCGGYERISLHRLDGTDDGGLANFDLINIPEKHVRWMNLYHPNDYHKSKEAADNGAQAGRTACIRIEWEDGEGL